MEIHKIEEIVNFYNFVNFENFENPSGKSLLNAKRNISTKGIRKISCFAVSINPAQSWWWLAELHHISSFQKKKPCLPIPNFTFLPFLSRCTTNTNTTWPSRASADSGPLPIPMVSWALASECRWLESWRAANASVDKRGVVVIPLLEKACSDDTADPWIARWSLAVLDKIGNWTERCCEQRWHYVSICKKF